MYRFSYPTSVSDVSSREPTAADLFDFLSRVSRLLASSLDFDSTLATVSTLALPHMHSWCIVDLTEDDHSARRIIIHTDPVRQAHARRLDEARNAGTDVFFALISLASVTDGAPTSITDSQLIEIAGDEQQLDDLRALSIGSIITKALIARNNRLGTITFFSGDNGHAYARADVLIAEDLAARFAMALDNARLYTDANDARGIAARMNERLLIAAVRQQELTDEARDANLAKSQFLAMMSHELRTPLNAIVGYADLIDLGIAGPVTSEQRRYIKNIHTSTYHLVGIIDDILDLAKIQAGRMDVYKEQELARVVITDAVTLVEPQAAAAGLTVDATLGEDETIGYVGDVKRVRQVLVNLLSNAVKFTSPGGSVTIACESSQIDASMVPAFASWTVFRVTDTGIGISETERAAIFEPFVQLGSGKTRTKGGTGLGLTISRELARRMGGDLTVTSVPGNGSTFSLWLPSSVSPVEGNPSSDLRIVDGRTDL